ncbi:hypothetical protein [Chitinophaga sp.]|uniref:hypothetical protein n=1 Tax=Chitinophaga sp. TaxID=1869181 RepID=UPI0031D47AF0
MAIVKDNILLKLVDGSLGDIITIYVRNGQIIMAKKRGPSTVPPSCKQLVARLKMKIAVALAKEMIKDPEVKAALAAKAGPGQNAFNMAVREAYNTPIVQEAEWPVAAKKELSGAKKNTPPRGGGVNQLFLPENLLDRFTQFREIS